MRLAPDGDCVDRDLALQTMRNKQDAPSLKFVLPQLATTQYSIVFQVFNADCRDPRRKKLLAISYCLRIAACIVLSMYFFYFARRQTRLPLQPPENAFEMRVRDPRPPARPVGGIRESWRSIDSRVRTVTSPRGSGTDSVSLSSTRLQISEEVKQWNSLMKHRV